MRKYIDANIIHNTKKMTKEEWLQARKKGIGGSDAASVLGLNPYKSYVSVYMDKIYEDKESLKETSYNMKLGNKLKNFVANEFTSITGKKVRSINGILKNEKYPYALGNIDKSVVGEKTFLECKVTNSYSKKLWKKEIPIHYQIQCYHYMAISGASHCYVAALIGNEDFVIHKLERNEEFIYKIMELEKIFWEKYILDNNIPMPDGSDDYSKMIKDMYKYSKENTLILFEKEDILNRYDELNKIKKDIENEKKIIEQNIQLQMKDYEVAYIGNRKITWKNVRKNILDTRSIKKEHPELVNNFMKTTTSRVFKIN